MSEQNPTVNQPQNGLRQPLLPPDKLQMAFENMAQDIHSVKMNVMALTKTLMESEVLKQEDYMKNFKEVAENFMKQVEDAKKKAEEARKFEAGGVEIKESD